MKIKISKEQTAIITLISTLLVTTVIDLLVVKYTAKSKPENDSSSVLRATEHDGNRLYATLLDVADKVTTPVYENASVDELISIGLVGQKFCYTCIASDTVPMIALYSFETTFNDLDDCFRSFPINADELLNKTSVEVTYYTLEDMSIEQTTSYKSACNITGTSRFAYGKTMDANKNGVFFASYVKGNEYTSILNATFNENTYSETNATITKATRYTNSYVYWLLFKMCA